MKKLYFALIAFVGVSASAAVPVARTINSDIAATVTRASGNDRVHILADTDDAAEHDWQSVGISKWTDDILSGLFRSVTPYNVDIDVEADLKNPGMYRIVDPFSLRNPYYDQLKDLGYIAGENGSGRYITIDATDPDNVIIPPSSIGLMYQNEEMFVCSYSYFEQQGELPAGFCDENGLRGTFVDGIFAFTGTPALWLSTPSKDAAGTGFYANTNGAFRLMLPDAKDYSITLWTASWCCDNDGNVIFSPDCGVDVAYVKAGVVKSLADTDAINAIVSSTTTFEPGKGAYVTINGDMAPNDIYYLYALSYDALGNKRRDDVHMVYTPDLSTEWTTLDAPAVFTDYIVSNVYTDIDLGTYDVEVQEHKSRPGYYRLVNPYIGATYNTLLPSVHGNHEHYMYLDASDPQCVILEESPIGMVLSTDGDMRVTSDAYILASQGMPKDIIAASGKAGRMVDDVITFPSTCKIYTGFHTEGMNSWYYCNYKTDAAGNLVDGDLRIDLKAARAGISDASIDAEVPVHYYNLQGIEVTDPQHGQILIRKSGAESAKIKF